MTQNAENAAKQEGGIGEMIKVILQALALALIVRTFLFQPFNIPSGSMMSTLLVGDYIFVNKMSYGYSKYSFPLSPDLFNGRVWEGTPERGDVAVFRLPANPSLDYVKRVIGLPGDKIQMVDGALYLNGEAVKREKAEDFRTEDNYLSPTRSARTAEAYIETLPNGVSYTTLDLTPLGDLDTTRVFEVPAGHYFMMGDNRDNSADSRTSQVGFVPLENFIGRANIVFFSIGGDAAPWQIWKWPSYLRASRIFNGL